MTARLYRAARIATADRARAEAFVAKTYDADPNVSRSWLATHRKDLVRYAADAEMLKRVNAGSVADAVADTRMEGMVA